MNLLLDKYADNPIIDELVFWPPKSKAMLSVRACSPLFRRPFIEMEFEGGETLHRHFMRENFAKDWSEAVVILEAFTTIKIISDFSYPKYPQAQQLAWEAEAIREDCIKEADQMYQEGLYVPYLMQFGEDCKDLPEAVKKQLAFARSELDKSPPVG
ncbi:MAG: hypothetical protein AAF353_11765 [Pseudomonadota bacterium]